MLPLNKEGREKVFLILLAVLLMYIAYDKGMEYLNNLKKESFEKGYSKAYEEATSHIIDGTLNCKSVIVSTSNNTIEIVTRKCAETLQQQSYLQGVKDTASKIIEEGKTCEPVLVSDGIEQYYFMSLSCLQK